MINTDDLDNMSRRDLVELLEAYNSAFVEVKRLRKYAELVAVIGDMIYENNNSYELTWDEFSGMLKEMIE